MNDLDAYNEMMERIPERRKQIERDAPCEGCGSTLAECEAQRGKDPTAPPWFGCCARGMFMDPCRHEPDQVALLGLLREIESGNVRSLDEILLDSLTEFGSRRSRLVRRGLAADARESAGLAPICPFDDCGCSGEAHP